ncbi:8444_t:CDS:1 [Diversispora eburnea]|uniref:8444_t:CDS:1 n=1 Tax=Diversispora eburnea TaxID=1213867 RepID=A0A9N9ADB6_9GLOM|nr:8444_t:CDS:1 [Diversispora eburnea]
MLSIVNAIPHQLLKRKTEFQECTPPPPGIPLPSLLSVSISPDPVVPGGTDAFTITGTLTKPITSDYLLYVIFVDITIQPPAPIQPIFNAKIPTGTSVNVVENVPVPAKLPPEYGIIVAIVNDSVDPPDVIGCANTIVGGTTSIDSLAFPF